LKAAVAVKTAHVVHDRIQRRQQEQWATGGQPAGMTPPAGVAPPAVMAPPAGAPQAAAPVAHAVAAAPPPVSDMLAQLTQLGELKAAGVLTEAEFAAQKARILNG
jgi:hypothetical protein